MVAWLTFLLVALSTICTGGLVTSGCGGSGLSCSDVVCDDGKPCTEDSCSPDTGACERVVKTDWAPCDFDGHQGACEAGVCAELEWPADSEEQQRIKALCENRTIEDCEEDARCGNLTASRFDPTLVCLEPSTEVGCTNGFRLCGLSLTTGESPDGELYRFSDTCHPKGWRGADNDLQAIPVIDASSCEWILGRWPNEDEAQTIREECEGLNGTRCRRDECRTLFPLRVDNERTCLEISHEHEVCTSRFRMCDPTPTVARAQSGESFVIGNDCVLESWEITGSLDGAQRDIFSWPTCGVQ